MSLSDPLDYSPRSSSICPSDSPGKNTGVGCHFLLQRIFLMQGSNPWLLHLLHCRDNLYHWNRHPSPVFLPGKFHGQRSLVDDIPWGCKESDTTEHACTQSQDSKKQGEVHLHINLKHALQDPTQVPPNFPRVVVYLRKADVFSPEFFFQWPSLLPHGINPVHQDMLDCRDFTLTHLEKV